MRARSANNKVAKLTVIKKMAGTKPAFFFNEIEFKPGSKNKAWGAGKKIDFLLDKLLRMV